MKKVTVVCDRCGSEMSEVNEKAPVKVPYCYGTELKVDLCTPCLIEFRKLLEAVK